MPIFDLKGSLTAWLKDNLIFSVSGAAAAYLNGENVINYAGVHCGSLKNGFFRDHGGNIVAFIKGATGGPMLPVTKTPPVAPMPGVAPIKPVAPMTPVQALPSLNWSGLSWRQFISKPE